MIAVSNARMGIGGGGREIIALASTDLGLVYHCLVGALPAAWTVDIRSLAPLSVEGVAIVGLLGVAGREQLPSPLRLNSSFLARRLGDRGVAFGLTLIVVEDVEEFIERLESDLVRVRIGCSSPLLLLSGVSVTSGDVGGEVKATETGEDTSAQVSTPLPYDSALLNDKDEPGMYVGSKCIQTSSSSS